MIINTDLLRPTALAALAAILSQEAAEIDRLADDGIGDHGDVGILISATSSAVDALSANVGDDLARTMLVEAGADPDYI